MKILSEIKCFVGKSKSSERFIYYIVDLYKEFQLKTWIESKEEKVIFSIFLKAFEITFSIFKFHRVQIVSKIIKFWPTYHKYQFPVIKVFMQFCKELDTEEQKILEKILVHKFDELFLYSQSQVFDTC